jgi:hypothetical protein
MTKRNQQRTAFGFGVVFVVTMLVLAILFPNPTPFQYTVFRIVLALAAAGVAAMIPGILELEFAGWIRAGGALAVFVVVYFYNPASTVSREPPTEPTRAPAAEPTNRGRAGETAARRVTPRSTIAPEPTEPSRAAGKDLPGKPNWVVRRQYIWSQPGLGRVVYCAGSHQQTDKISSLVFLQLVNQSERPRQVVGYRVEIFHEGRWQRFGRSRAVRSDASTYVEFAPPGAAGPVYIEFTGKELDRALAAGGIAPGASVEGWALLDYYAGPIPNLNAASDLRMTIEDSYGQTGIFAVLPPPEDDLGRMQVPAFKSRGWRPPCDGKS